MKYFGHYTNMAGLKGILESEVLWATNIKFLNDEHEFQHTVDLFKEIIPKTNIKPEDPRHALYSEYETKILKSLNSLSDYKSESVFTLSFSQKPDLLSQWRGYCPNHNGYCLVFDVEKIVEDVKHIFKDMYFLQCVYEKEEQDKSIREVLNNRYSEYIKCGSKKEKELVIDGLTRDMVMLAAQFKNQTFSEEEEHRIIVVKDYDEDIDVRFREGRASLIPYILIPAKREYIKTIIIGPTENKALSLKGLQSFVEKMYGVPAFLTEVRLELSKSPYRPW